MSPSELPGFKQDGVTLTQYAMLRYARQRMTAEEAAVAEELAKRADSGGSAATRQLWAMALAMLEPPARRLVKPNRKNS